MQVEEFEIVLRQITMLGKAQTSEEINIQIHKLLETIGNYACAGRVFIFETVKAVGIFTNTYEWCADGIVPQIENLQTLSETDMPVWYERLSNRKSIIIPDLEKAKEEMPLEYDILKAQDIHTEIAVPIIHKNSLIGFVGLDNPRIEDQASYVHLLEVVGSYIGNIWENVHTSELLRMEQGKVAEGQKELGKKQQFLEVLCRDFTSVYYMNLVSGKMEIVKLDEDSNMSKMLSKQTSWDMNKYSLLKERYINGCVIGEYVEFLRKNLELDHLKKELKEKATISYFYHSTPNAKGHQYFEAQAIRMDHAEEVQEIMLGFRHVDEIVMQERKKQDKLEYALREIRTSNDIISAISKIYYLIYRIDLVKDHYVEITSESEVYRVTGKQGEATKKMQELCDRFVAPEYHESIAHFFDLSTMQDRLREEDTIAMEYLAKDGNWHLARFIVKNRDEKGEVTNILYVTRIVNDEKHREQNWILVAEEANRQNEAKSDFLSRMAHDIRTPLNAIRGLTSIIKNEIQDPEKVADGLKKIDQSGIYLQQLIDDILDLERIEKGKMKIEEEPCELKEFFDELRQLLEGTIGQKNLTIHWEIEKLPVECVMADKIRLKQVYMNLLSNAVKYTPEGGNICLHVSGQKIKNPSGVQLTAQIKDDGIGMTSEYMEQMYNRFTRAVDTRVNEVRGSGLGLAIVKELVDIMHGKIDVESELGKGTVFTVTVELPKCLETELPEKQMGTHMTSEEDVMARCKGMHLLVAEDNDLNYEVISELLAMQGIICVRAENGVSCVEIYQKEKAGTFDAILMDMQMPVMNGVQAAELIREQEQEKEHIKIIAVTANAFQEDIDKCRKAGMDAHLSKPIDMQKLCKLLAEA